MLKTDGKNAHLSADQKQNRCIFGISSPENTSVFLILKAFFIAYKPLSLEQISEPVDYINKEVFDFIKK